MSNSNLGIRNHEHITDYEAKWYSKKLYYLIKSEKGIEKLFFYNRKKYNLISEKKSSCKLCYSKFSEYFYNNI